jgi:hypothetical protein
VADTAAKETNRISNRQTMVFTIIPPTPRRRPNSQHIRLLLLERPNPGLPLPNNNNDKKLLHFGIQLLPPV